MNIVVFDTETTSLNKPFCYNIGYVIMSEDSEILLEKDFVVEQVWHNLPLFSSAYYAEKRPLYVQSMRARKTSMNKFGYICREMIRDFKEYNVQFAYAYNSSFDEKVFEFNCDWFKCSNPFDTLPILDIRGNVHQFVVSDEYRHFCEENEYYTESGCYSSTAETVFRYLSGNNGFIEDHTALSDSQIEAEILYYTFQLGADCGSEYETYRSLGGPKAEKVLHIRHEDDDYFFKYNKIVINKTKTEIILK